jgi:hypothetical protein
MKDRGTERLNLAFFTDFTGMVCNIHDDSSFIQPCNTRIPSPCIHLDSDSERARVTSNVGFTAYSFTDLTNFILIFLFSSLRIPPSFI